MSKIGLEVLYNFVYSPLPTNVPFLCFCRYINHIQFLPAFSSSVRTNYHSYSGQIHTKHVFRVNLYFCRKTKNVLILFPINGFNGFNNNYVISRSYVSPTAEKLLAYQKSWLEVLGSNFKAQYKVFFWILWNRTLIFPQTPYSLNTIFTLTNFLYYGIGQLSWINEDQDVRTFVPVRGTVYLFVYYLI